MSQQPSKTDIGSEASSVLRPWGVSFSFAANAILGIYFLVYPLLRDPTLYPLFTLGALSLLASYGFFRMTKWGVWLGAALYPEQITAAAITFLTTVESPGLESDVTIIALAASLVVLMFLSTLSFLFILDKRRIFK